jgi:protein-S-isoprenylcysteine O-methyltransferase Ste14
MVLTGVGMWLAGEFAPALAFEMPGRMAAIFIFAAAGLVLGVAALVQFRRRGTTPNPMRPEEASALVTAGLYRYSRNPMYVADALILLAWALLVANAAAFVFVPLFVLYLNRYQIRPEESALRARFGAEFERYCAAVRRWL